MESQIYNSINSLSTLYYYIGKKHINIIKNCADYAVCNNISINPYTCN